MFGVTGSLEFARRIVVVGLEIIQEKNWLKRCMAEHVMIYSRLLKIVTSNHAQVCSYVLVYVAAYMMYISVQKFETYLLNKYS